MSLSTSNFRRKVSFIAPPTDAQTFSHGQLEMELNLGQKERGGGDFKQKCAYKWIFKEDALIGATLRFMSINRFLGSNSRFKSARQGDQSQKSNFKYAQNGAVQTKHEVF